MNKWTQPFPIKKHLSCDYHQSSGKLIKLAKILNDESTFNFYFYFSAFGSHGLR
jgi:hypothetical protein